MIMLFCDIGKDVQADNTKAPTNVSRLCSTEMLYLNLLYKVKTVFKQVIIMEDRAILTDPSVSALKH